MNVDIIIVKPFPKAQLNRFPDETVRNMASITLERTTPHIPELSGHMKRDILGRGVKGFSGTYTLGTDKTSYSKIVWKYPQSTNWTNKKSYAQWFMKEFELEKQKIVKLAVGRALKVIK